ncbi:hypothetical protein Belba_3740 [Belliella baltica DSM 15883]|uniref:Uncharacterized protein n=1 Tax=Belliella baltica (strain DSM 15883 / CIP 108006 / LMG 21964 / BA134) TaxID=866536 RepID=I3ZAF8_BELBD|nr:hypothetical protein [Belliella baltica]AFL86226.1 hypothetical protein Belba_3740 [Belliella baltica DSM 15883]
MKVLNSEVLVTVSAGGAVDSFCSGFGIVAATYGVGALANWWNPPGQAALVAGSIIGLGCAVYAIT